MEKKTYKKISISVESEVLEKLNKDKYNKSKLIDYLLDCYFNSKKKMK